MYGLTSRGKREEESNSKGDNRQGDECSALICFINEKSLFDDVEIHAQTSTCQATPQLSLSNGL
jgi:hypothetical protein